MADVSPYNITRKGVNTGVNLDTVWLQFEVAVDRPDIIGPWGQIALVPSSF